MIVDRPIDNLNFPVREKPVVQIQAKPEAAVIGVLTQSDIIRFVILCFEYHCVFIMAT